MAHLVTPVSYGHSSLTVHVLLGQLSVLLLAVLLEFLLYAYMFLYFLLQWIND